MKLKFRGKEIDLDFKAIWPADPNTKLGMRGEVRKKTKSPIGNEYRALRQKRKRVAERSKAKNR